MKKLDVGGNIRKIREARRMTQQELADSVGVSKPMICRVERGTKNITVQLAVQISEVLGCELEELAR